MTAIWNKIENLKNSIEDLISKSGNFDKNLHTEYNWHNTIYSSSRYRRAHIEVVDNRESNKIYILHCTIFPHFNDPSPIWGFDAVCGASKITGAFHDFSSAGDSFHPMMKWFEQEVTKYQWQRNRELPEWARYIFSKNMVAVSNINQDAEVDNLCQLAIDSLQFYLSNVGITQESGADYHMAQDRYCYYQKQNPHVINSMVSMGVPKDKMIKFVNEILFPETNYFSNRFS
jgi:hypothetical protein